MSYAGSGAGVCARGVSGLAIERVNAKGYTGIAVGIAIGVAIGAMMDNVAMGIGIGIALGIAMMSLFKTPGDGGKR